MGKCVVLSEISNFRCIARFIDVIVRIFVYCVASSGGCRGVPIVCASVVVRNS